MAKEVKQYHEGYAFNRDIIAMSLPPLLMAFFFYGPRVIVLALIAVITAGICDRAVSFFRSRKYDKTENSSVVIALLLVMLMPVTARYHVIIASVMVAVLIAKEAFGGVGSYPFSPVAVGFCAAAVSWPNDVLKYPTPQNWPLHRPFNWEQILKIWRFEDVVISEGPSHVLKSGGMPTIDSISLLLGDYAGPMGATASLVIISCAIYLIIKKRINISVLFSFLLTVSMIAFIFPRYSEISLMTWPVDIFIRLSVVKFELLSSAMLFVGIYILSDQCTMPRYTSSRIIYGFLIGFGTMMFRYFGTYEMGACFAIILVNAVSGYFDRAVSRRISKKRGV